MDRQKSASKDPLLLQAPWFCLGGILLLAAVWKGWLAASGSVPFNADEAVVSLMARHILQGERPVFFYGQSYMGSLDAYLISLGFSLFGQSVWVIRLVQGVLYLGVLFTTAWMAKLGYGSWTSGAIAMLLLAIPSVNVSLYTTVSLGCYGETLLIGNLLLLLALSLQREWRSKGFPGSLWKWACIGLLSGFGLWVFGLSLIYSAAVLLFLWFAAISMRKVQMYGQPVSSQAADISLRRWLPAFALLAMAGLVGSLPWLGYAWQHGLASLVGELGGSAIAGAVQGGWLQQTWVHFTNLAILGSTVILGFRPPWAVEWLALPLLPLVLFFWLWVLGKVIQALGKPGPQRSLHLLSLLVVLLLLAGFVFTPFGADPSGRYFVPLSVPLALWAGWAVGRLRINAGRWAYALAALLLLYHAWGTLECVGRFPPGLTTQFYRPSQVDHREAARLVEFLTRQGEHFGYTHYWVTYPLAFLSQERLIFVPHLPYHPDFRYTRRDDRYQPYTTAVEQAQKTAYITTQQPELQAHLRRGLAGLGVSWQEEQIGEYLVFYRLSRVVRPGELNFGATTNP